MAPTRTPRKAKAWATSNFSVEGGWAFGTSANIYALLDEWKTDIGVTQEAKVTIMRVVGRVYLGSLGAASTAANDISHFGFTWLPADVANQSAGDSAIPIPLEEGMRRSRWYHQFELSGKERTNATETGMALEQPDTSVYSLDVTNQQKQVNTGDKFCLVSKTTLGNWEAATVGLFGWVSILVALP